MKIVTTKEQLRNCLASHNRATTGFVPTMGALHAGHCSLVECARQECETVVVSIFVNPNQFNDPKDLKNYPRTPEADCALLEAAGADIVFIPTVEEMYPSEDTRLFDFGRIDKVMEGATRPGHFNGVGQVVSRLFDTVDASKAYFGAKDFQQVAIISEMVRQLNYDVQIIECPTIRDTDGLALSSRNTLLEPEYRAAAPDIYKALKQCGELLESLSPAQIKERVVEIVEQQGLLKVIYFEIVDSVTMQSIESWDQSQRIQGCIAVQAGGVRLIDNIKIK